MSDINWEKNAVCYANGKQWLVSCWNFEYMLYMHLLEFDDFKLNEIRLEDYVLRSDIETKEKYDNTVSEFELFGFERSGRYCGGYESFMAEKDADVLVAYSTRDKDDNMKFLSANEFASYCKRQLTYHQIIAIGKLKRMMLERAKSAPKTNPDLTADFAKASSNKYEREITDRQGNIATVDVYDVLKAFNVTCPATQHAVKKLLCSGLRGHKDLQTDLTEAKESIVRAIELN